MTNSIRTLETLADVAARKTPASFRSNEQAHRYIAAVEGILEQIADNAPDHRDGGCYGELTRITDRLSSCYSALDDLILGLDIAAEMNRCPCRSCVEGLTVDLHN